MRKHLLAVIFTAVSSLASFSQAAPLVFSVGGQTAAAITPVRDAFRTALGGGTVAGSNGLFSDASGERREINWDGVPDAQADPNSLPADFFNVTSPRGVVFSTPGTGFLVSAKAASGTPVRFGTLQAGYPTDFSTFSAERLFTAVGSNITDVNFFLPGTTTPATVSGFGAVFTDVDIANSTTIEYFSPANISLGVFPAPVSLSTSLDGGLSFLGVQFDGGERVARVRITSGNGALGPNFPDADLVAGFDPVVMDDFIYSNPVPEPSTIVLFAVSYVCLAGATLRRKART